MKSIKIMKKRFAFHLLLMGIVQSTFISLFCAGGIIFILRFWFNAGRSELLSYLPLCLIPITIYTLLQLRRIPREAEIRSLLDKYNNAGGLLISDLEIDIGNWQKSIKGLKMPVIIWCGEKELWFLFLAILFTGMSFFVPHQKNTLNKQQKLNINSIQQDISSSIEQLKKEAVFSEKEAEEHKKTLKKIAKDTDAQRPAKTWNAINLLEEKIAGKANKKLFEEKKSLERLKKAQTFAKAFEKMQISPEDLTESMQELSQQINKAIKESQMLNQNALSEKLQIAMKNMLKNMTTDDLEKLNEQFKNLEISNLKKLKNLEKLKYIDPNLLKSLQECSSCNSKELKELKDFLKNEMCKPSGEKLSSLVCSICNKPGKFGIKRGRADAAMTWHYPSSERGAKYTEKTISQAKLSLMNSQLIGVSSVSGKDHAKLDDASLSGALLEATAGGGATHKHRVLPKHKSTLKRFFKREN